MRILIASSEVQPFAKTGGLADMTSALGKYLALAGHEVGVVTPLYRGMFEDFPKLKRLDWRMDLLLGHRVVSAEVWTLRLAPRLTGYFIHQPEFYQRRQLYQEGGREYPDNAERFIYLSKAVAHLARHLPWKPEIVHAHDWQTGLVPLLVHHQRWREGWTDAPLTCLTIHNLAYQGNFGPEQYRFTNLPWDYFHPGGAEFYGTFSCLKTGLSYADWLTTVSPRYAQEITTPELGCGMDGVLRQRQAVLTGILNGVDYAEWNTAKNPHLRHPYRLGKLAGKRAEKRRLQTLLKLPVEPQAPLFGNIGRLAYQKGVDILTGALEELLVESVQCVVLGTGDPAFESALLDLSKRYPERMVARLHYDETLAHQIEAGSDFFVMPSRYEPCGLNQLYSLRYGTIPIVRATGGLDDSVVDVNEAWDRANGIKFHEHSVEALAGALRKALVLYRAPLLFEHFRQNGMQADFSWKRAVGEYVKVYRRMLEPQVVA